MLSIQKLFRICTVFSIPLLIPINSYAASSNISCSAPVYVGSQNDAGLIPWSGSVSGRPQIIITRLNTNPTITASIMLLDAGADAIFGTRDDITKKLIDHTPSYYDTALGISSGKLLYQRRSNYIPELRVLDSGRDLLFGTSDDTDFSIGISSQNYATGDLRAVINDNLIAWLHVNDFPGKTNLRFGGCDLSLPSNSIGSCKGRLTPDRLITVSGNLDITGSSSVFRVTAPGSSIQASIWMLYDSFYTNPINFGHILGTDILFDPGIGDKDLYGTMMSDVMFFRSSDPITRAQIYELGTPSLTGLHFQTEVLGAYDWVITVSRSTQHFGTYVYQNAATQRYMFRYILIGLEAPLADLSSVGYSTQFAIDGPLVVRTIYNPAVPNSVRRVVEICR